MQKSFRMIFYFFLLPQVPMLLIHTYFLKVKKTLLLLDKGGKAPSYIQIVYLSLIKSLYILFFPSLSFVYFILVLSNGESKPNY
jgi:hypothetical protein